MCLRVHHLPCPVLNISHALFYLLIHLMSCYIFTFPRSNRHHLTISIGQEFSFAAEVLALGPFSRLQSRSEDLTDVEDGFKRALHRAVGRWPLFLHGCILPKEACVSSHLSGWLPAEWVAQENNVEATVWPFSFMVEPQKLSFIVSTISYGLYAANPICPAWKWTKRLETWRQGPPG